jgi:hypothetical protein
MGRRNGSERRYRNTRELDVGEGKRTEDSPGGCGCGQRGWKRAEAVGFLRRPYMMKRMMSSVLGRSH